MTSYGHGQYTKTQVATVDSGRLIVLLYEGAISFLVKAKECMKNQDHPGIALNVNRAMDIIDELDASLNTSEGGEVAQNLRRLYRFMNQHLIRLRAENDTSLADDVIKILSQLNEAWKEALKTPEAQEVLTSKQGSQNAKPSTKSLVA